MGENAYILPPTMQRRRMYLFNLYHHQELNLTPVQGRGAYIKLRALKVCGCKEQFIIESLEHAMMLIIKDIMVKNILSIEVECHPVLWSCQRNQ